MCGNSIIGTIVNHCSFSLKVKIRSLRSPQLPKPMKYILLVIVFYQAGRWCVKKFCTGFNGYHGFTPLSSQNYFFKNEYIYNFEWKFLGFSNILICRALFPDTFYRKHNGTEMSPPYRIFNFLRRPLSFDDSLLFVFPFLS